MSSNVRLRIDRYPSLMSSTETRTPRPSATVTRSDVTSSIRAPWGSRPEPSTKETTASLIFPASPSPSSVLTWRSHSQRRLSPSATFSPNAERCAARPGWVR